ncbi:MAG: shikimate kinase, partial [Dehalococcoidia bacterium]|nr:shikimate kinase [Dehalococcoidia bacterium]
MDSICLDNIILEGLSGTGKRSVGERVGLALDWRVVEMDSTLEVQAGKCVPRIFAENGEASFRQMERVLLVHI